MSNIYFGFRFFSAEDCTMGNPNPKTHRCSIAGAWEVFLSKDDLEDWLSKQDLTSPSGLGGGRRVKVTKRELRRLCAGESLEDFNFDIEHKIETKRREEE